MQYILIEIIERDGREIYRQELSFADEKEREDMITKLKSDYNAQRLIAVINGNGRENIGLTQKIETRNVEE